MTALLVILAQAADLLTGLALPNGAEANPIIARALTQPLAAVGLKLALVTFVILVARYQQPRMRQVVLGLGMVAGSVGLASNLWAMA